MTAKEKKELVAFLKHGDKKQICKMAGVHETVMYAWISDRLKTSSIEPYVIQLAAQRKREIEDQTGEPIQKDVIDSEIIIRENFQLKTELRSLQKEIVKTRKLISGKNKIYQELFIKLKEYINQLKLNKVQKEILFEKLEQFRTDFSFLNQYEKYADILNTVNPLFSRTLDTLNATLSQHEKKILSMIRLNLSNHEIAVILAVSEKSIQYSKTSLKEKLKLKPREELSDFIGAL